MDWNNIRDKPITFIDPLDPSCHPANLINVVSGQMVKLPLKQWMHMNAQELAWWIQFLIVQVCSDHVSEEKASLRWEQQCVWQKSHLLKGSGFATVTRHWYDMNMGAGGGPKFLPHKKSS